MSLICSDPRVKEDKGTFFTGVEGSGNTFKQKGIRYDRVFQGEYIKIYLCVRMVYVHVYIQNLQPLRRKIRVYSVSLSHLASRKSTV